MGELHRLADAAGRDPDGIGLIVLGVRANAVALDACRVAGAAAAAFELAPSGRDA
ncbi:MAG: hypothetical protein H0U89_11900, partial [Acidimicrobiia bacterium]|nr:hypothetical protein [Acidimicrobiia bacterium]